MRSSRFGKSAEEEQSVVLDAELKIIVFGLHWTAPDEKGTAQGEGAADLDAWCLLLDEKDRVLEAIHPARPESTDGSVVHTGDSRTGASAWDDERVFVFLEPLPGHVATVAFAAVSANGRPFGTVPGAACHVSDASTEMEILRVDLTALGSQTEHCAAAIRRSHSGWTLSTAVPALDGFELRPLVPRPAAGE